jgi:hypothetical protein
LKRGNYIVMGGVELLVIGIAVTVVLALPISNEVDGERFELSTTCV